MPFDIGTMAKGTLLDLTEEGALVDLGEGVGVLRQVRGMQPGQKVTVQILGKDSNGRYVVTLPPGQSDGNEERRSQRLSFEEKLQRFLRESQEVQRDLKRHLEAKRGRR